MFSIDGLVSGLDTTSIIEGLVSLQESQVERLNFKKNRILIKQQAFSGIEARMLSLRSKMSRLNRTTSSVFSTRTASSSNESLITATAGSKAAEGSYNLRVISRAKAHQIGSQGFDSSSASVTEGTISFQVGDRPATEITIDSSNNTVSGLVEAINDQSDDISAAIVHDQSTGTDRILLSSQHTGSANQITVTNNLAATAGEVVQPDFSGVAIQEATNAAVQLGSGAGAIIAEYESNEVEGLIENVTLDLLAVDPDQDVVITVSRDNAAAVNAVSEFVDEYNSLIAYIEEQTRYNAETNTASPLLGNRSVSTLKNQLSAMVTEIVPGTGSDLNRFSQIGIEIDGTGRLTFNSSELESVLNGEVEGIDPNDVQRLFGLNGASNNANIEFILGSTRTQSTSTPYQVDILQAAERGMVLATTDLASSIVIDRFNNTFQISIDGLESELLTLTEGTYTQEELADHLQSLINSSAELGNREVTVSLDGAKLEITSSSYGSSSNVSGFGGTALADLGFDGREEGVGIDVAGSFIVDGVVETATGSGRILIGDSDNENTADLQIRVTLDPSQVSTGIEGELTISRGATSRIDQYFSDFLAPNTGSLETINEGFDLRIESIDASIARVNQISESKREYLIKQFSALERVLSELQSTAGFLTSQLG
jgi:flagellar hook-associated protein 2